MRTYGKAEALTWLDGIKTNAESHIYPDNEAISAAVNRGIVAFGVVNQYYWYRMRAEIGAANVHSRIAYFSPRDPGYVLDISGAAVMKSSRHEAAAQRLLGFLVSAKAQEIIAHSISFEYPIVSGSRARRARRPSTSSNRTRSTLQSSAPGHKRRFTRRAAPLTAAARATTRPKGLLPRACSWSASRAPARLPVARGARCGVSNLGTSSGVRSRRAFCGTRSASPSWSPFSVR